MDSTVVLGVFLPAALGGGFLVVLVWVGVTVQRAADYFGSQLGKSLSIRDDSWAALRWGDDWRLPLWNFWCEPAERLARIDPEFHRLRRRASVALKVMLGIYGAAALGVGLAAILMGTASRSG
jgi:hypothetical protein